MIATITPYRCAECGSGKVTPFCNGKMITASIANTMKPPTITEYKCSECGAILPYCMNATDKAAIDSIVTVAGEDDKIVAEYLKKYKNIEINHIIHMVNKQK